MPTSNLDLPHVGCVFFQIHHNISLRFFLGDRKNNKFSSQKRNGSIHRNAGDFTSQKILENLHHETWGGMKPEASTRHVRGQKTNRRCSRCFFLRCPITKNFRYLKWRYESTSFSAILGGVGFSLNPKPYPYSLYR